MSLFRHYFSKHDCLNFSIMIMLTSCIDLQTMRCSNLGASIYRPYENFISTFRSTSVLQGFYSIICECRNLSTMSQTLEPGHSWNVTTVVVLLNVLISLFSSAYDDVRIISHLIPIHLRTGYLLGCPRRRG